MKPLPDWVSRQVMPASALSQLIGPAVIDCPYGSDLVWTEGGVAGTHKLGGLARRDRDPLPVVELAVRGAGRWRPVVVDDVATGQVRIDHAGNVARGREEAGVLEHLLVHRRCGGGPRH